MNAKELYIKETGKDRTRACFEQIPSVTEHYISWLETKVAEQHQALQLQQGGVITSVCDNCKDVTGFYLGTTCPKCNKPFRVVEKTEL